MDLISGVIHGTEFPFPRSCQIGTRIFNVSLIARISKGNLNNKCLISSKCFNRLLKFKLAIFKLSNSATQCNIESHSPIAESLHATPEMSFILTSNGEVSCVVMCSLFACLAGWVKSYPS